jgi:hypothetical protein
LPRRSNHRSKRAAPDSAPSKTGDRAAAIRQCPDEGKMSGQASFARMRVGAFVIALAILTVVLDGTASKTEALDRWVGPLVLSDGDQTVILDFIVLVDPGRGASFEWRFRSTQIFTGGLAANVSGSSVTGTLFPTGGLAVASDPLCCAPCNFRGTIVGNRVDGTLDPRSCSDGGGTGTFTLTKQ